MKKYIKTGLALGTGYLLGRKSKNVKPLLGAVRGINGKGDINKIKVLKKYERPSAHMYDVKTNKFKRAKTSIVLAEVKDRYSSKKYYPIYFVFTDGSLNWLGQGNDPKQGLKIWKNTISAYTDGKIVK